MNRCRLYCTALEHYSGMCSITVCSYTGLVKSVVCVSFNGVMVSVSVCSAVCVDWGPCIRICASSPYHGDVAPVVVRILEWFVGGPPSPPSRVSRQLTLTVGHASNARGDANTADTTAAPYNVWASLSNFDWEAPRRLRAAPIVVRYHVVWGHLASTGDAGTT